jgi:hypothetical protein
MEEIYHVLVHHRARSHIPCMARIELFRSTDVTTDCDQCGGRVDLIKGGVCVRCRRILCYRHLHGSFVRRLLTDLGAETICVACRATRR